MIKHRIIARCGIHRSAAGTKLTLRPIPMPRYPHINRAP